MGRVIILEGPDGAGKTTAADQLVKMGWRYFHEGPPPKDQDRIEYYAGKLWKALNARHDIIYDRFHLGEMVYAPIARHEDLFGYYGMKMFRRIFWAQPARCVVVLPDYQVCHANWKKKYDQRNDYLMDSAKFRDSYYRFMGLASYHERYDYQNDLWGFKIDQLLDSMTRRLPAGVIGHPRAKFLIVGERTNKTATDFPFINSHNSSRFLNDALWEAGYQEEDMAFTNSYTWRGKVRNIAAVRNHLSNLQVVLAFGQHAHDECVYRDLPHEKLVHPACFFRFHQKKRAEFVKRLKEIREAHD